MRILVVALLLMAGCTTDVPAEATLGVDFGGVKDNIEQTVAFDPDDRPAEALYGAHDATHPDLYNGVDLVEQWAAKQGADMAYAYYSGLGFLPERVDGVDALYDEGHWWLVRVDGQDACVGLHETAVEDGTRIDLVRVDTSYAPETSHCE